MRNTQNIHDRRKKPTTKGTPHEKSKQGSNTQYLSPYPVIAKERTQWFARHLLETALQDAVAGHVTLLAVAALKNCKEEKHIQHREREITHTHTRAQRERETNTRRGRERLFKKANLQKGD